VDVSPIGKEVMCCDISLGLPFADESYDAVYSSNMLEHLARENGQKLLKECCRVLKRNGTTRIVVPDLENICRCYLHALDQVMAGDVTWAGRYEWIILELLDQIARTQSGGEMAEYLRRSSSKDKDFIISRIGCIGRQIMGEKTSTIQQRSVKGSKHEMFSHQVAAYFCKVHNKMRQFLLAKILTKRESEALSVGLFRLSGEVHMWMYDRYSLESALHLAGFSEVRQMPPNLSRIHSWSDYCLDVDRDGEKSAPLALYIEAVKM